MQVNVKSILDVFSQTRTLHIPYFQRAYVWGKENWEKFYNDIADIALAIQGNEKPETYFIGSIILRNEGVNNNNGENFGVIDGQQRLSTFVIFMKALYLSLGGNDAFKQGFIRQGIYNNNEPQPLLLPNYNDRLIYNRLINLEILNRETIDESSNMANAFAYFADRIINSRDGIDNEYAVTSQNLLTAVMYYIKLVCIEVSQNENAQKIFETINCTGVKLTTGEMLKNYLYDEHSVEQYEQTWKRIMEDYTYWNDEEIAKGRLKDNHIENFLYRYMLITMQEPIIREELSTIDRQRFRKHDNLYGNFIRLIENYKIDIDWLKTNLMEYATAYKNTFRKDVLNSAIPRYPAIERIVNLMFAQSAWTMTPYILYILNNQHDSDERRRLFGYLETYLIRRIFCQSRNNNYSDMFSENLIGQGINTYEAFRHYVNDANSRGALIMPSDEELRNAIMNNSFKKAEAKLLLYMLETKQNENFRGDTRFSNGYADFEVQQIMPDMNNEAWANPDYSETDRKRLTQTIGNYALIRHKLKNDGKKLNWEEKRNAMRKEIENIKTSEFISRMSTMDKQFSETNIELRNQYIAELAINHWKI